jgi:hypothetical protein
MWLSGVIPACLLATFASKCLCYQLLRAKLLIMLAIMEDGTEVEQWHCRDLVSRVVPCLSAKFGTWCAFAGKPKPTSLLPIAMNR